MKKSILTPVVIICSMMMLPVNANAFWLDIVKEFVTGGIKTIMMPKNITTSVADKPVTEAPQSSAQPKPEDIWDALSKLDKVCQEIGKSVPCSIGIGRGLSIEMARDKALAKARIEMANTMGTFVSNNTGVGAQSDEEDGIFKETATYLAKAELKTEQFVSGAQQYMSYTYIDEAGTELNKGKSVYVTTVVMVMNKELFVRALEEVAKEKPLSQQIIKESKKGVAEIVKTLIKKI